MPRLVDTQLFVITFAVLLGGCEGPEGPTGADGADGAIGAVGAEGAAGANGANGADGVAGAAGVDGEDGEDAPIDYSDVNLYAAHDIASVQYRDDCLTCHADILLQVTRDAAVDTFHVGMIKVSYPTYTIPDDVTDVVCQDCHYEGVDLMNKSQATFGSQVSTEDNCYVCHSGGAWPLYTY